MTSLRSCTRYPSGGTPPIHIPFFFEAAILSRMRSPMTSRSNWAKDNRTLRVKRPIEVVVLNCCVTETNDAPCHDVGEQPLQSRPTHRHAGEPAVIITRTQAHPAFVALAGDEGLAGLALRLQRIEFLVEPLLGGFAGVNGAANPCVPRCDEAHWSRHRPALAPATARVRLVRPKNRGPDQWASVIRSAIAVSDR